MYIEKFLMIFFYCFRLFCLINLLCSKNLLNVFICCYFVLFFSLRLFANNVNMNYASHYIFIAQYVLLYVQNKCESDCKQMRFSSLTCSIFFLIMMPFILRVFVCLLERPKLLCFYYTALLPFCFASEWSRAKKKSTHTQSHFTNTPSECSLLTVTNLTANEEQYFNGCKWMQNLTCLRLIFCVYWRARKKSR